MFSVLRAVLDIAVVVSIIVVAVVVFVCCCVVVVVVLLIVICGGGGVNVVLRIVIDVDVGVVVVACDVVDRAEPTSSHT